MAESNSTPLWGVLGDLEIELITSPKGFSVKESSKFTEHEKIESKPGLQWVGDELNTISLSFRFAAYWCDPDAQIRKLRAARLAHKPMRLVVGNNVYKGSYVIEGVGSEISRTDGTGQLITVDVEVSLKEVANATTSSTSGGSEKSPFVRRR